MIPKPAQYLLRFDDLCPTVRQDRWELCRQLIRKSGIRAILAVVPDNRDPDLSCSPTDPEFWEQMRRMEAAGSTIAVHGYHHVCNSRGESLLGLHGETEFAGVDLETQRNWIREGFRILQERGLHPRLWAAPRHGFDENTFLALRSLGVEYVSDGFARSPFRRYGITWIPQQLWGPAEKSEGLWTICVHPNCAVRSDVEYLQQFVERHADKMTSFERVVEGKYTGRLDLWERMYQQISLARVQQRFRRHRGTAQARHAGI